MIWTPSPNFGTRKRPITLLVMHYTGMRDGPSAINWLANPKSGVSAHYVVEEDGQIIHMVKEENRAHHAGHSYWRGITDVNSASIGIEIVNPGHEWGYRPFPKEQMKSVRKLTKKIIKRHNIALHNVIGHSDIAPDRKQDPGELFDWDYLAKHKLAIKRPIKNLLDPLWNEANFIEKLRQYGYGNANEDKMIMAFQRRFRPNKIDGVMDEQCRSILYALLLELA